MRVWPMQLVTEEESCRRPERGDLCQREVDEDDPAVHHVQAQVAVNAREDEARDAESGRRNERGWG